MEIINKMNTLYNNMSLNDYQKQILEGIKKLNSEGWKDINIYWAYSFAIDKILLKQLIESLHHE